MFALYGYLYLQKKQLLLITYMYVHIYVCIFVLFLFSLSISLFYFKFFTSSNLWWVFGTAKHNFTLLTLLVVVLLLSSSSVFHVLCAPVVARCSFWPVSFMCASLTSALLFEPAHDKTRPTMLTAKTLISLYIRAILQGFSFISFG